MKPLKHILLIATAVAMLSSCMDNDLTYPRTKANVTEFTVEGQISSRIDVNKRTVTVYVESDVDVRKLVVESASITDGAVCDNFPKAGDVINLSSPLTYTLSIYYDYEWTISASQDYVEPKQLTNMNFDDWYYDGKVWYPCLEEDFGIKVWDTANAGVASILSTNPTMPEDVFVATLTSKHAAKLTNMNAVIKFAAGNIITGEFLGVTLSPVGAHLTWGTPFTHKPKGFRGYYCYEPGLIDFLENQEVKEPYELDRCQMLCMLTDWDEPFEIDTANGIFVDQENDEHIIAYFRFESDESTNGEYVYFEHELEYRRPDATPKYAVVIFCASQGGDVFTGSTSSVMYVDEVEFFYDDDDDE